MISRSGSHHIIHAMLLCFCSAILSGCPSDNKDLRRYLSQVKLQKESISFLPRKSLARFQFPENENRRNPFLPNISKDRTVPLLTNKPAVLPAYSLNELLLVGTLSEGNKVWALVEQPDKQIIVASIGDHVGKNKGVVINIQNDSITLLEDAENLKISKQRVIKLFLNQGRKAIGEA